ncbi:MAG TPA: hypothetical protein VIP28_14790 [Nocardioides sp.]
MKAHLFNEGGGMVTGTHDVKAARRLIVDEFLEWNGYDHEDRLDVAHASAMFSARCAELETGRIVPNNPETGDPDYSWFWRSGYKPGKPGVTKAVVWHA